MRLMNDLVGETFSNRYRLVSRLAGGGMGEVYRGHDLLLDRAVAIKVLQPSLAADQELVARFKAEARAAARLTHPNVVAVHDWGAHDDRNYYMVMEYVSGTDLRDILVGRGTLQQAQAVEIVTAVCDALAAAHRSGLVHRDIKPENVLIARDGTVKVADFGIAAVIDPDVTQPGAGMFGTLRYLAPEQARGEEATAASDIWAAGALLAELLTGRPPLQGSGAEILQRRASDPPIPPSAIDPRIGVELDAIVMKACALDPRDRFTDASDMAIELRRVGIRALPDATPLEELFEDVTGEISLEGFEPTTFSRDARGTRSNPLRVMRSVVALMGVLLLLVAGAIAARAYLAPRQIDVPELIGVPKKDALSLLEGMGLKAEVVGRVQDRETPRGVVVAQQPVTGSLQEGSVMELTLAAGPPRMLVPSTAGMSVGVAEVALRAVGMKVGDIRRAYAPEPAGTVIKQDPADGRAPWGSSVDLVVSRGPRPVVVPEVAGMKPDKAKRMLKDAGFSVALVDTYSNSVPKGRVIGTNPPAGTTASEGGEIELLVSVGPEFERVVMPDVRNMSVAAARSKLESLGLRVRVIRSNPNNDIVVDTDPLPGAKIRENDIVVLFT